MIMASTSVSSLSRLLCLLQENNSTALSTTTKRATHKPIQSREKVAYKCHVATSIFSNPPKTGSATDKPGRKRRRRATWGSRSSEKPSVSRSFIHRAIWQMLGSFLCYEDFATLRELASDGSEEATTWTALLMKMVNQRSEDLSMGVAEYPLTCLDAVEHHDARQSPGTGTSVQEDTNSGSALTSNYVRSTLPHFPSFHYVTTSRITKDALTFVTPQDIDSSLGCGGCQCTPGIGCMRRSAESSRDQFDLEECSCMVERNSSCGLIYNTLGQLSCTRIDSNGGPPIFECGSGCSCMRKPSSCILRVYGLLNRRRKQFCVFHHSSGKGWGLRSQQDIKRGELVCEYVGELISSSVAQQRRAASRDRHTSNYILTLNEMMEWKGTTWKTHLDASWHGNESRFINHSCHPNLIIVSIRVNSWIPHLALFANMDIAAGVELTFDYSDGLSKASEISPSEDWSRCLCHSSNCQGYLPSF